MAAETQLKKIVRRLEFALARCAAFATGPPTPRERSRSRVFFVSSSGAWPRGPRVHHSRAGRTKGGRRLVLFASSSDKTMRKVYRAKFAAKAKPHAQHAKTPSPLPPPSRSHRRLSLRRCISRRRHDGSPPLLSAAVPGSRRSTPDGPTRQLPKSRPLRRNRPRA